MNFVQLARFISLMALICVFAVIVPNILYADPTPIGVSSAAAVVYGGFEIQGGASFKQRTGEALKLIQKTPSFREVSPYIKVIKESKRIYMGIAPDFILEVDSRTWTNSAALFASVISYSACMSKNFHDNGVFWKSFKRDCAHMEMRILQEVNADKSVIDYLVDHLGFPSDAGAMPVNLKKTAADLSGKSVYARYLLSKDDMESVSPADLSPAQAMADFSVLKNLLKEGYAGYDYFAQRGTNWKKLFKEATVKLKNRDYWPVEEYLSFLDKLFKDAGIKDNHLYFSANISGERTIVAPYTGHWTPRFADYYVERKGNRFYLVPRDLLRKEDGAIELLKVNAQTPDNFLFQTYVPSGSDRLFLLGLFAEIPINSISCMIDRGSGTVEIITLPLHPIRKQPEVSGPIFEFRHMEGIPYVALRSMRSWHSAEMEEFIRSAGKLRSSPVAILDLRGNNGGNDGYGISWLRELTRGPVKSARTKKSLISPVTMQGEVNMCRGNLLNAEDEASRKNILNDIAEAEKHLKTEESAEPGGKSRNSRHWETTTFSWSGYAAGKFTGMLLILSDARNGSAGESFLEMIQSSLGKRAIVMGENSTGVNTFGPQYRYQLPNSRIQVFLTQGINVGAGGQIFESKGFSPDIWMDDGDVLPAALSLAKRLAERK